MNKAKALIALLSAAAAVLLIAACEGTTPNTVKRNVEVDYTGFYAGQHEGGRIPNRNSGAAVTFMNVRQTGSKIEAVDNTGFVWNGQIENNPTADNLQAIFTLKGRTTAGNDVTISGNFTKSAAAATVANMTGTWIEPTFYAVVRAIGTVSATVSNSPPPSTNTNGVGRSTSPMNITPVQQIALYLHTQPFVFHKQI